MAPPRSSGKTNRQNLYELIHDPITISKWIQLGRFPDNATDHIDSEMASKHTKALKPGYQRWLTKHASHNCGVGTTLVEWQHQEDDQCPCCGQPEDTNHVIRCMGMGATETWSEQVNVLTEWMTEANTHPLLQDTILANLQRWHQGLPPVTTHAIPKIQQMLESQTLIEWRNLMEGHPSCWIWRIQQKHILQTNCVPQGKNGHNNSSPKCSSWLAPCGNIVTPSSTAPSGPGCDGI